MKSIILCLLGFPNLIGVNSLTWSDSYSYEAVLTVPDADIEEPYKVWYDGTTGNTRVDYYNGIVKIYRLRWYGMVQAFDYYKIYPVATSTAINKEVCRSINPDYFNIYAKNAYLPTLRNFIYQGIEQINGIESQKWKSSALMFMEGYRVMVTYTIWSINDSNNITIPLRYEYKENVGDVIIDHFHHEYIRFSVGEPDDAIFDLPAGLPCSGMNLPEYEPYDPVLEYIDPTTEHARISKDFEKFKTLFDKKYDDPKENFMRINNFRQNLRSINSENRKRKSFSLAVNHLADASDEEIAVYFGTDENLEGDEDISSDINQYNETTESDVVTEFDWREFGAVSPVKDQTTMCSSCYAFATAAATESSLYIKRGFKKMLEVSEQAIIDCSWGNNTLGNYGCRGGSIKATMTWILDHGIPYTDEYGKYLAMEGLCHATDCPRIARISGFLKVDNNENKIKWFLRKQGPLAVTVDARPLSFTFYTKGIYDDNKCNQKKWSQNHALTLIGYGEEDGVRFWILKNSYGTHWGEDGYIRIAIDNNTCGVMNSVYSIY